jgi:hypothetical protein
MCPVRYPLASADEARPGGVRRRLGQDLRALREASSMRLEDAARMLGVVPGTLSRIENGRAPARTMYVRVLLHACGRGDDSDLAARMTELAQASQRVSWWHGNRAVRTGPGRTDRKDGAGPLVRGGPRTGPDRSGARTALR